MAKQIAEVVFDSDALVSGMLETEVNRAATTDSRSGGGTITVDVSFSGSRNCPLGGDIAISGNMHRTFDTTTLTMEATFGGDKTMTDCAFMKEGHTLTVNGAASWDAFRRRVDFRPDGLQTSSYSGSITAVRDDGEERSCDFSVEAVRDPATHTLTITAMVCGNEFSKTITWDPAQGDT